MDDSTNIAIVLYSVCKRIDLTNMYQYVHNVHGNFIRDYSIRVQNVVFKQSNNA